MLNGKNVFGTDARPWQSLFRRDLRKTGVRDTGAGRTPLRPLSVFSRSIGTGTTWFPRRSMTRRRESSLTSSAPSTFQSWRLSRHREAMVGTEVVGVTEQPSEMGKDGTGVTSWIRDQDLTPAINGNIYMANGAIDTHAQSATDQYGLQDAERGMHGHRSCRKIIETVRSVATSSLSLRPRSPGDQRAGGGAGNTGRGHPQASTQRARCVACPRYEQRPFDGHDRVARSGGVLAGHASTWLIAERGATSTLKAFSTVSALTSSCRPMRSCRPIMPAGPRP